jgi:hypothetical protein
MCPFGLCRDGTVSAGFDPAIELRGSLRDCEGQEYDGRLMSSCLEVGERCQVCNTVGIERGAKANRPRCDASNHELVCFRGVNICRESCINQLTEVAWIRVCWVYPLEQLFLAFRRAALPE